MIKGLGYLKYLKQSLIGFGISCFILLGGSFVNGVGAYTTVGINSSPSVLDSSYNITFLKGGGLLTNFLGQGKSVLALRNNVFVWWSYNGFPYFYLQSSNTPYFGLEQGFPDRYYLCDEITEGQPSNCIESQTRNYSGNNELVKQDLQLFFKKVNLNDLAYYDFVDHNRELYMYLCRNSSEIGRSLCFKVGKDNHYISGNVVYHKSSPLINSQNFTDLTFGGINNDLISYAPGQAGYGGGGNIDGGSYTGDFNQMDTGNVVNVSCSKKTALMWYRCNGYKTRMCYSSYGNVSDIYNGPGVSNAYDLTGVDIENVWFDSAWYRRNGQTGSSMSYSDWFDYWRKTYIVYKQNPQHTNPFLGVPVSIFTLMGNVDSYGLPYSNESILEFCDLSLYTRDYSAQYNGVAKNAVCNMSSLDFLDCQVSNELNPDDGLPGDGYTDGTVGGIGNSWQGITNRSGYTNKPGYNNNTTGTVATGNDLNTIADGKTFENNFFTLLTESFKFPRSTGNGFLPNYIILALCALVLFRFLSH